MFPNFFKKKKKNTVFPENLTPKVKSKTLPGKRSVELTEMLKRFECPQITYTGGTFPIFFKKTFGANIADVDQNRYLDLTSMFGVMSIGHSSKAVQAALLSQSKEMIHGMGDVHPNEVKINLAKKLSEITPGNLSQTIFSSTGSEAVETALKTAVMHTKKTGVIALEGAYHGLGYGALNVTHRSDFRKPFEKQMGKFSYFAPFPDARLYGNKATQTSIDAIKKIIVKAKRSAHSVGAVIVEPIQGRGGIMLPPPNFLKELRMLCDQEHLVMIADEVFTGFGRTGHWFASGKYDVVPDLMCIGKAMGAGFPISACIGSARIMHSWGQSTGDAIHTSTFLGHPLACSVSLAVIQEIEEKKLVDRSKLMGDFFRKELYKLKEKYAVVSDIRGSGLMIGIELSEPLDPLFVPRAKKTVKKPSLPTPATAKAKIFIEEALKKGLILLPSASNHNVISITPPFVITEKDILYCVKAFDEILKKIN